MKSMSENEMRWRAERICKVISATKFSYFKHYSDLETFKISQFKQTLYNKKEKRLEYIIELIKISLLLRNNITVLSLCKNFKLEKNFIFMHGKII